MERVPRRSLVAEERERRGVDHRRSLRTRRCTTRSSSPSGRNPSGPTRWPSPLRGVVDVGEQDEASPLRDLVLQVSGESGLGDSSSRPTPDAPFRAWGGASTRCEQARLATLRCGSGRAWRRQSTTLEHRPCCAIARRPFTIAFRQDERPFFCRTPFFYSDPRRSFLVIPDGRYLSDPDSGSPLGAQPASRRPRARRPLDLPDQVTTFHVNVARAALAKSQEPKKRRWPARPSLLPGHWETTSFRFKNHHHPFVRVLDRAAQPPWHRRNSPAAGRDGARG